MAYEINKTNGTLLTSVPDGEIDTSTSIRLVGKNFPGYGEIMGENLVNMLENFSNPVPPVNPMIGQVWHNSQEDELYVFLSDNTWHVIDTNYRGTQAKSIIVKDVGDSSHYVLANYVNNKLVMIISSDAEFTPKSDTSNLLAGINSTSFPTIGAGMTLSSADEGGVTYKVNRYATLDNLTAETTARVAGDLANTNAISAETSARITNDLADRAAISAETSTRIANDLANTNAISTETAARIAGDLANTNAISAETTARIANDLATANAISAETAARIAGDLINTNAINAEANRALNAEAQIIARMTTIPAGTLLRTECRGFDKWGYYANGTGGEYSALIMANSPDCGYTSGTGDATGGGTGDTTGGTGDATGTPGDTTGTSTAATSDAASTAATGDSTGSAATGAAGTGDAGAGTGAAGTGDAGAGTGAAGTGDAGAGTGAAGTGDAGAGAGTGAAGTGDAGAGAGTGAAGTGGDGGAGAGAGGGG